MKNTIKKVLMGICFACLSLFVSLGFVFIPKTAAAAGSFSLEKTAFREGEAINVTATGEGKDWVGIFREGENASVLWYYVAENSSTFNILNATPNTGESAANIVAGNYIIAFVPNDLSGIDNATQTQHIRVVSADAQLYLNKTSFAEGEAIQVTAFGSGLDWVGIYREGQTLSARWYYVADAGNGATVNLAAYGNNNEGNGISATISAGNYVVYLIRNDGAYTSAEVAIPITVTTASPLRVDQTQFALKTPIYVTATHSDSNAWVGLYRTTESEYCRWYFVKNANGVPFDITQGETNIETSYSPNVMRGDYYLRLFDNSGAVVEEIAISVVGDPAIPSSPLSATYVLDNDTDGFATGTVSVTMPSDDLTDRCIVLYWGDDNGFLEGYSYIKFHVTGEVSTFTFGKNVFIPFGATKLYVYAKNTNGDALSTECVTIDLPKGAAPKNPLGTDTDKSFWVISDLHIDQDPNHVHNQHFVGAMQDIARIDGDAMSLIINGDMTSRGREGDWTNFQALCDNATGIPPIVLTMGNHEYYNGYYDDINAKFFALAKYPDGTLVNKMHYDYWQGGYHFVVLGTDAWPQNNTHAVLSQETLAWLDATLDEGKDSGKPTFLFLHQPLYNTVAGSRPGEDYSGVEANSETALRAILADHPEVMLFVGHTHWTMDAEANMYEGTDELPTRMFNTSSAGYLWTTYDNASGDYMYGSEGYYIRVYGGTLYVMGYDFVNDEWISAAQYCVKLSSCDNCADNDSDHLCDVCGATVSECYDKTDDADHNCDTCGEACGGHHLDGDLYGWYTTSTYHTPYCSCHFFNPYDVELHFDNDHNHLCDVCQYRLSPCGDLDDHLCDECGKVLSTCEDTDNDHHCNLCHEKISECEDNAWPYHNCDICGRWLGDCFDEDDHYCDICDELVTTCYDTDDHYCDLCGAWYNDCYDNDNNHFCDTCDERVSDCEDNNPADHVCDKCGTAVGDCEDNDNNHLCDVCHAPVSFCKDDNPADHYCDICGDWLGSCESTDGDHFCDVCNTWLTCVDYDDHLCDICGNKISDCFDVADDNDHLCDTCGAELTTCEDGDTDGYCDTCGAEVVEQHVCEDADFDHYCDECEEMLSTCEDTDNDHNCDYCSMRQNDCYDDDDHLCDICGEKLSNCYDYNEDHLCDICGERLSSCTDNDDHYCDYCHQQISNCINDNPDHLCDICGVLLSICEDIDHDHFCDTCGAWTNEFTDSDGDGNCDICGTDHANGGGEGDEDFPPEPGPAPEPEPPTAPVKTGCGGSIGGATTLTMAAVACIALLRKKKEN